MSRIREYMRERPLHAHLSGPCPDPAVCARAQHPLACDIAGDARAWNDADQLLGWAGRTTFVPGEGSWCNTCGAILLPVSSRKDVTREDVLAKKAELEAAGEPSGYRPLADALGVSTATIRRRLGTIN